MGLELKNLKQQVEQLKQKLDYEGGS